MALDEGHFERPGRQIERSPMERDWAATIA
jgi:hypothetical protein